MSFHAYLWYPLLSFYVNTCHYTTRPEDNDSFEELTNCKYTALILLKKKNSQTQIEHPFDEIQILIHLLNFEFDILCFSESKILYGTNCKTSIYLRGYQEPIACLLRQQKVVYWFMSEMG